MLKFIQKTSLGLALVTVLGLSFFVSPNANAVQLYPKNNEQNVSVKSTRDNVYASGANIEVNESVAKDVVLAGSNINISGNIGRSIIGAGQNISINSNRVGGAVRLAGLNIKISGNFGEEVIIAGSSVIIENAKINGDLIVSADNLVIKNSEILGDAKLSYKSIEENQADQIKGQVEKLQAERKDFAVDWVSFIAVQLSILIALLILSLYLKRRNALHNPNINFNRSFWINFAIGLGFIIFPLPLFILGLILQLYPLTILLVSITYLTFILASFFLPMYVGNLAKNAFKLKFDISIIIFSSFVIMGILSIIPFVQIASFVFFFIILISFYGFLVRSFYNAVNRQFVKEEITENSSEEKNEEEPKKDHKSDNSKESKKVSEKDNNEDKDNLEDSKE